MDLSLFKHIESQTTDHDKRSLLAVQAAMKQRLGRSYRYLEIGSFLGGSLQPHVVDPDCVEIISIDPRPALTHDERGLGLAYVDNSTRHMLELLGRIPEGNLAKLRTLEAEVSQLSPAQITPAPDYCLIDGEHTDAAVLADARFCLQVVQPAGSLVFHDANITYGAIHRFLGELEAMGRPFQAFVLPDAVFVVDLGLGNLCEVEPVRTQARSFYRAYLFGLLSNDKYRAVLNRPLFRRLRRMRFVRRLFLLPDQAEQVV